MLEVQHIFKTYEGNPLLHGISFTLAQGETIGLLGASGSGKSTLLRIIAGLEQAESGEVVFDGQNLSSTPAHLRDFGLVFQDYALFPHLDVRENVAFGLKMRRLAQSEMAERVASSLAMVNLSGFEKRRVTELSGGEQQRVALARALATQPRLLMFDEPLGALDRTLREDLLNELRAILHRTNIPAIYVTHDQEEVFTIADRVLILHDGEILREGAPAEVWTHPKSVFVAELLGLGNIFEGTYLGNAKVETRFGSLVVDCDEKHHRGDKVYLLARPLPAETDRLSSTPDQANATTLRGIVTDVIFQQDRFRVTLDDGYYVFLQQAPGLGERIEVRVKVECLA